MEENRAVKLQKQRLAMARRVRQIASSVNGLNGRGVPRIVMEAPQSVRGSSPRSLWEKVRAQMRGH